MAKICINRNNCRIVEENDLKFLKKLDRELSFFIQGAEYSKAYRGYTDEKTGRFRSWDGRNHLLSDKLYFSPGLLERVKRFYNKHNKSFQIVDNRTPEEPSSPIDISSVLESINKTPYPYQLDVVDKVTKYERGIIRTATGSGKSLIATLITAKLGKETIIYVIGKDLLYQMHDLFTKVFDQKIGIIGDGKCEVADINIATVWTVGQALGLRIKRTEDEEKERKIDPEKHKQIRDVLGKMRLHIFDECHLAASDTIQGIFKRISSENLYGMSASPWRDDGCDLLIENYLGHKVVDISASDLIEQGYLVRPTIRFLAPEPYQYKSAKNYKSLYSKYIVQNENRNNMILKGAEKLVEQKYKTLVLFHNIKHGDILYDKISKKIPCAILSGKDNSAKRKEIREKLEEGKIDCILASKIFDIGIDLPALSGLIIAGGGKSSVRALQRVGRVIRTHPGKERAAVIDFADQAPWLLNHAKIRRKIYEQEFEVQWPGEKRKQ